MRTITLESGYFCKEVIGGIDVYEGCDENGTYIGMLDNYQGSFPDMEDNLEDYEDDVQELDDAITNLLWYNQYQDKQQYCNV